MIVKILGSGCANCTNLETKVRNLIKLNEIEAEVVKVTQIQDIIAYKIMRTPGLVIDEVVKSSGIIPQNEQILRWLKGE